MSSTTKEIEADTTTFPLNNGNIIPAVGFGAMQHGMVFPEEEKPRVVEIIKQAIKAGYRLIDTSKLYATEDLVGEAIRASGVPRSEITVLTKLLQTHHHDPQSSLQESLRNLDVGYIDIFVMHWPSAKTPDGGPVTIDESPTFIETYKKMEKLVGPKCRSIGVSNFTQKTLEPLLKECTIKPVVNQIEVHPLNPNLKLIPYCQERQIQVMAWGPLAGGPKSAYFDSSDIYGSSVFTSLASRHDVSIGVIILSWLVQRGVVVIPHTESPVRMAENLRPVRLTDDEITEINDLHQKVGQRRLIEAVEVLWGNTLGKGKTLMGWTVQDLGWADEDGNWLT